MTDKEKLEYLMSLQIIRLEGWAGVLPNGNIVDRRKHPTAIPMQKNTLLGIPEPRPLPSPHNAEAIRSAGDNTPTNK
jgi:hypothetical protein